MQSTKATNAFGNFYPNAVSQMTVDVASTIEKAESIPKVNRVMLNMIAQRLGAFIKSQAVG